MTETARETALLVAARQGNEAAFDAIARAHTGSLLTLVRRLGASVQDAEDVVQETWLAAHRALPTFRGEAPLKSWLSRIAVHAYYDLVRAGRRVARRFGLQSLERDPASAVATPPADAASREAEARIAGAIAALPPRQRETLRLRVDEQLSYRDIAARLGVSVDAVRINLIEARRKLAARLDPDAARRTRR